MNIKLPTWEELISYESLYRAHRKARLGKRHKKEVIEFELNLSQNLWALHYELKYHKYNISGYHKFMIYDPKEREIQAISYRDRIVQHTLCDNYLTPLFEKKFIYDNCACRKGKGTHFALKRFKQFMQEFYNKHGNNGRIIKLDMAKYFNSINHDVLKNLLNKSIYDKDVLKLCHKVIDSYNFQENKGLPMGNQSSQCFALLYLNSIDHMLKEKLHIKYYVRYMDDIVMIVKDKLFAKTIINQVKISLEPLKICLNHKSQQIAFKNGVIFLGWKIFCPNRVILKVKKSLKLRIIEKIKYNIAIGGNLQESLVSYSGMFIHGNAICFFRYIQSVIHCKLL